jgi:hypothetical protein
VLGELEADPQPARAQESKSSVAPRRGASVRIASLIFEGEQGRDNWTEGQNRGRVVES